MLTTWPKLWTTTARTEIRISSQSKGDRWTHPNLTSHHQRSVFLPTWQEDGSHGHEAVEVDGGIEGDVPVEEGLSAQRDEVTTHGEERVGKQEGDGGRWAAGDHDAHHRSLRDACRFSLQTVVWTQHFQSGHTKRTITKQRDIVRKYSTHSNTVRASHQPRCCTLWWSKRCVGDNSQWIVWNAGSSAALGSLCTGHAWASHRHLERWRLTYKYIKFHLTLFSDNILCSVCHLAV